MRCCLAIAALAAGEQAQANPIRKVVSLLQGLQEKIEAEAKQADKLLAKFECFCEANEKKTAASIVEAGEAITRLESDVEVAQSSKKQVDAEVKQHKEDRENANAAISEAEKMRAKENADFAAESGDMKANIDAMNQAIPAIEKGMSGSFLQTPAAAQVSRLAEYSSNLSDGQKQYITQFLQGGSGYAPASGQIVGILKQMKEEMEANLAEITKTENETAASHNGMMAAKNKEIAAATDGIESKTARSGELAVEAVNKKADLKATIKNKAADENYLAGLKADCAQGKKDEEAAQKDRGEELVAIADTIKLLNSDEALELFKKTLPSPSLLQIQSTSRQTAARALAALRAGRRAPGTDLIMLALEGKNPGFQKVLDLIDKMLGSLKKEQEDDDEKVTFCKAEIDKTEDQGKELSNKLSSLSSRIGAAEDDIKQYKSEIGALVDGIKALDKAVADATEQRKDEHEAYVSEAADNNAALQLLGMAKNRLNKFYHPKEYKEPPKEEKTEAERIEENYSFVQVSVRDAPEAPELKGHSKSDTGGVLGLMDMLIQDLKKEIQEAEFGEKDAQEDYEKFMGDSKAKRAEDAASKTEKDSMLADAEGELLDMKGTQRDRLGEFQANSEYLSKVHADCDWNIENYDARKTARTEEVESLKKAKDIVNGADFSFVQVSSKPTLLTKSREQSCTASDVEHRRALQGKLSLLQGFCEDMCKAVGKHPDCSVCDGFIPPDATPGVMTWDELYAQFDKLKLVGRDHIKEWTGDAGKFGR